MDKFCIVKRRKRPIISGATIERPGILSRFLKPDKLDKEVTSEPQNLNKNESEKVGLTFCLTDEQTSMVKNSGYFEALLRGTVSGYNLTIDNRDDGQIVFNLNFDETANIKLLKPKQVCKMLQISRYFLRKLVKQNKIKSFKVGCLTRFDLNDVLDFLSKSVDITSSENIVNFIEKT